MKYINELKSKIKGFICERGNLEIVDVDSISNITAPHFFFKQVRLTHGYTTIAAINRDDMSLSGTVTRYTSYINGLTDADKIKEILEAM